MQQSVRVAPSILAADFSCLGDEVRAADGAGADYIHIDVMDGHFVPNISLGPVVMKSLRQHSAKPFDVHLMISPVDPYIPDFVEAGADIVFPDALASEDDFRAFAKAVPGRKMANMTEFGRTPYFTDTQFEDMGYDIVIWPATSMRVAAAAMIELYAHIRDNGGAEGLIEKMPSRAELYETIGYYDYEALDESIAKSVVPEAPGE